jgi:hypothetical protein
VPEYLGVISSATSVAPVIRPLAEISGATKRAGATMVEPACTAARHKMASSFAPGNHCQFTRYIDVAATWGHTPRRLHNMCCGQHLVKYTQTPQCRMGIGHQTIPTGLVTRERSRIRLHHM